MDLHPLFQFAIALFIGALIGAERTINRSGRDVEFAGLRTFTMIAIVGALSAWLSLQSNSPMVFVISLLSVAAILVTGYLNRARLEDSAHGITTEVAAIAVFLLGGAVVYGYAGVAVALSVAMATLLALKDALHGLIKKVSSTELLGTLQLLFATFIILPLLPNKPVDPWNVLVPYKLWLLVILISSISMVGYIAIRWKGAATGTLLTALFGGLASSTAVTLNFARFSRDKKNLATSFAAGVMVAWAIMFLRILVEVAIVNTSLLSELLWPMCGMAAVAAIMVAALIKQNAKNGQKTHDDLTLSNPFRLLPAIQFAVLFAGILILSELARQYLPGTGVYLVAIAAGTTDVDAITLSMAQLAKQDAITSQVAVRAIVIAALTNTAIKLGILYYFGTRDLAAKAAGGAILIGAVGLLLAFLM